MRLMNPLENFKFWSESKEMGIYIGMLMLEKMINKWVEVFRSKKEQKQQDRELPRELKSRLRNLEERKLIQENKELTNYEKKMKDSLDAVLGEMKTWKMENKRTYVNFKEIVEKQLEEKKMWRKRWSRPIRKMKSW